MLCDLFRNMYVSFVSFMKYDVQDLHERSLILSLRLIKLGLLY